MASAKGINKILDSELKEKLKEDDRNTNNKAKRRRMTVVIMIIILLFSILASIYYLIDSMVVENSYKVYVNGTNNAKGLRLSYDSEFGQGYKDITGKGIRLEDNSNMGLGFGASKIDYGDQSYSAMDYLMSVCSNQEGTIKTNVIDKGQAGEANGDQFLVSKFYLKNTLEVDELNGVTEESVTVNYAIQLTIENSTKNALSACRFAIIEVLDEENIYKVVEDGQNRETIIDNNAYNMSVIAQPKIKHLENGDMQINKGDEPDSEEYVGSLISGQYTNDEEALLVKNPKNKDEDWKCKNLHYEEEKRQWYYNTVEHETEESKQVFSIKPQEQKAYVVATWYEASDPDHTDAIKGGYVSFSFTFYAVEK